MLKHLVLFNWKPETDQTTIDQIMSALSQLKDKLPGIVDYTGGPDVSTEGLNQGYTHGFVMTFDAPDSLAAYLPHPEHQAVVQQLMPAVQGVLVFDLAA